VAACRLAALHGTLRVGAKIQTKFQTAKQFREKVSGIEEKSREKSLGK